jgi:hypothetical protein
MLFCFNMEIELDRKSAQKLDLNTFIYNIY